ncbi:GspE/PulE family protein [Shewanella aestuarii]|uniref:Type II/IV secretion system protein n=1 Tax=Shewanella aestuarii TaxID=1028752 RepID=A0A6G9QMT0_9GAMM|nr:ATPase, T2SS/T4P/T4SS family [Shewanella aestuarii]QIR15149.1 type II/IV secretion system protein [Shewanella aestuarii]
MSRLNELLKQAKVSEADIEKATVYQKKYGGRLEQLLVNMGALSEDSVVDIYSQLLNIKICAADEIDAAILKTEKFNCDSEFLEAKKWFIYSDEPQLSFVTATPYDLEVRQYLQKQNFEYSVLLTHNSEIQTLSNRIDISMSHSMDDLNELTDIEEDKLRELASEAPVVNLLNSLITRAVKAGASDMHLEPWQGRYRARFRIDGVLHEVESISSRLQLPLVSRLKILSGMDIAEKRRPQDGKIEMRIANSDLDIRVSALPLNESESIVLRFLRKDSVTYDMSVLGLSEDIQSYIREDLLNTAGVILLTGPTGSGKTTSLYTFLNELNTPEVKIITLEDPVEYQLDGINQVQVKPEIGFDFSAGIRSIVRQDPDIIMVGEIRDQETARIAMQSSLTGHLVFSTVHTNDAPSAYTRLMDLGVEEFLLNAAIVSIVAQRLARKLCVHCARPHSNAPALIEKYNLKKIAQQSGVEKINLFESVGCDKCSGSGYKGRTAVIEYLRCDDELKAIPKDTQFVLKAKEHNRKLGRRTLMEDGLYKAIIGISTVEEVIRVAG